ncbi:helix-turn-helix transcriptional regulator [Cerasicoccus maritimus]|uniref:helix-turn-helix transcriptional regulator n=1 Tax=Cerasicoccus maritimus TaxID=490089 RepID=UPI002852D92B|nr:helix-turn-helix domain-containing protein [Cerasicoccus maritimus]
MEDIAPVAQEAELMKPIQAFQRRLRDDGCVMVAKRLGLRQNLPQMHFHDYAELFMVISGRWDFRCPHEKFSVSPNELAVVPASVPHAERAYSHAGKPFRGLVVCQHPHGVTLILSGVRSEGGKPYVDQFMHLAPGNRGRISRLLEDVAVVNRDDVRSALLYALLGLLEESLRQSVEGVVSMDQSSALVGKAQATIDAYLADSGLTVASLASDAGCTPDHLSRSFRSVLGMSAQAYLRRERMALAKRLLAQRELRISEVAWSCGFNSLNYFIRAFRQEFGQTPKNYRNSIL